VSPDGSRYLTGQCHRRGLGSAKGGTETDADTASSRPLGRNFAD